MQHSHVRSVIGGVLPVLMFLLVTSPRLCAQDTKNSAAQTSIEPQSLAPPPAAPAEKADRDRVGAHFNQGSPRDLPLDSEDRPEILPGPSTFMLGVLSPPFPFATATISAVGHVTSVQPYLSENRKGIYTEFRVQIAEVLKTQPGFVAKTGDALQIVRTGGSVRLPSGRVVTHEVRGLGEPLRSGHNYVVFLAYRSGIQRFDVIEAWELRNREVIATDVHCSMEERVRLTAYTEQEFLTMVRSMAR